MKADGDPRKCQAVDAFPLSKCFLRPKGAFYCRLKGKLPAGRPADRPTVGPNVTLHWVTPMSSWPEVEEGVFGGFAAC